MTRDKKDISGSPIAIVGMSCRFPGGVTTPDEYWRLLVDQIDAITEVPPERWNKDVLFSEDRQKAGKTYSRWGGFLENVDAFDPDFFGISPREAVHIDPQQRLLLEVAYEALEHAGAPLAGLRGSRTGVYVGLFIHDYAHMQLSARDLIDAYTGTGTSMSIAANRISYLFDLRGPSIALDTACSSSLVALHQACESLRSGECDAALAGGVNVILRPEMTIAMSKASMLSPDGRCHSFDASANGYVRAEGAGMVLLKRLDAAERDGDVIHAILRSTASNQDGRTKGISVPSGEAQEALVREAQARAGLRPRDIQYVEAHGTGTPVGDPIETGALGRVLREGRKDGEPCLIGSVKSNIGHTESASGMAGLLKVVLSLKHGLIPGNLHFREPNPSIDFPALGLEVVSANRAWPSTPGPRLACLNSFGFGGTNAHAIVQEGPRLSAMREEGTTPEPRMFALSAHNSAALSATAGRLADHLEAPEGARLTLSQLSYTLAKRRTHHQERLGIVASSRQELVEKLRLAAVDDAPPGAARGSSPDGTPSRLAFLFTGMGPQWWRMGRDLLVRQPRFRDAIEDVDALVFRLTGWSVLHELTRDEADSRIQETRVAQPCIFALQVGLFHLWTSWGIVPAAIAGHSVGEAAAAYAAGILSLEDAATVIVHRSRLQHGTEGTGTMLAVGLSEAEARAAIQGHEGRVAIGAINSPSSISLAGDAGALSDIERDLTARGVFARFLQVNVPYHSPGMDPLRGELLTCLSGISPGRATIPYYSTILGRLVEGPELDADYFWHNVRDTVVFGQTMRQLIDSGIVDYVELGAHPALARSVLECLGKTPGVSLPSLRREKDDQETLLGTLAELYVRGHDPGGPHAGRRDLPCELPPYAWQKQRYWDEPEVSARTRLGTAESLELAAEGQRHPLLGARVSLVDQVFENRLTELSYVHDHVVRGSPVFPGAGYLEMSVAAATQLTGREDVCLHSVRFDSALFWPKGEAVRLETVVRHGELEIHSKSESTSSWTKHMTATLMPPGTETEDGPTLDVEAVRATLSESIDASGIYPLFRDIGLDYGPIFQGITRVHRRRGEALAEITPPAAIQSALADHLFHPALLDACLHTLFCTLGIDSDDADMRGDVYLPVRIERFLVRRRATGPLYAHCVLHERTENRSFSGDIRIHDREGRLVALAQGLVCQNLAADGARVPEKVEAWAHEYRWQQARLEHGSAADSPAEKRWLLFCDERGIGIRVADLLRKSGASCTVVLPGSSFERLGDWSLRLDPTEPEHFRRLLDELPHAEGLSGVVYAWALDARTSEDLTTDELRAGHAATYGGALHLVQALAGRDLSPRLWLVTAGAFPVVEDDVLLAPTQAPSWGFARVLGNELPGLRPTVVDLGPDLVPSEVEQLASELDANGPEDEVALRGARRYVHRFVQRSAGPTETEATLEPPPNYALECLRKGSLDTLAFQEVPAPTLSPGAVEIEVLAVGLNFKDVMKATGLLPGSVMEKNFWQAALGMEFSGRVLRVGAYVQGITPGMEVMGFAHHAFARRVVTDARFVVPKPAHLGHAAAAGLPLAYVTAYYALVDLGRMRHGDTVLIHAATGGVGQAALALAKKVGARVLATAGSEEKRGLLKSEGVAHVFDSRSLDFAREVLEVTGGAGVDLILNSLAGDFIDRNLDVLGDYGRFLELGKIDIDRNHRIGMKVLDRNASLHGIDVDRLLAQRPEEAGRLLREVAALLAQQDLPALATRTFEADEVTQAFQHMASAKHVGKVVLSLERPPTQIERMEVPQLAADGTHLVTGGFGGFGLELLEWLAAHGARHLLVLSRSGPSSAQAQALLGRLARQGVQVVDERVDIASDADLGRVLARTGSDLPPLRSVFHAAAILDDDLIKSQTLERYRNVATSKLEAAWSLHRATRHLELDHFVCFSSVTSVLGNQGSANYVAANAFVDALAHYRRARGLPALTINWGLIANVGMAKNEPTIRRHLEAGGLIALHTRLGLDAMGRELCRGTTQVTLSPLDWSRWLKVHQKEESPRFSEVRAETASEARAASRLDAAFADTLAQAPVEQRHQLAQQAVLLRVARTFGTLPSKLDPERELSALGLDSLMALELRGKLEELGLTVPVSVLLDRSTVSTLTARLLDALGAPAARPSEAPAALPAEPEPTGRFIVTADPRPGANVRLICFPYAGGAPTAFHDWSSELPDDFEVSAINLPGRGRRIGEPAHGSIHELADQIADELAPFLDRPFAFYGHCMGSILMYEVAVRLRERHAREPLHLFVGGSMAPHLYQSPLVHEQSDEKFMDVLGLLDFTGTRSMLEDAEMRQLLLPTLRADFEAVANYHRDFRRREPLACPLTGFAAKRDLFAAPSSMVDWGQYTTGAYRLVLLDVHHYFVETHRTYLARTIAAEVARHLHRSDAAELEARVAELGPLAEPAPLGPPATTKEPALDAMTWYSPRPPAQPALRLYCFPSALGAASGELLADTALGERALVTVIDPPKWDGAKPSIRAQADVLAQAIIDEAGALPFAFFGHGSGAILMYEVSQRLAQLGAPLPVHLFVSSAAAPDLYVTPNAFLLGDDKLVDVLDVIGHPLAGELSQSARLRRELLPALRSDFEMMASYRTTERVPLDIPITALRAKGDLWSYFYGVEGWADCTTSTFELVTSEDGDHFHVQKDAHLVSNVIARALGWQARISTLDALKAPAAESSSRIKLAPGQRLPKLRAQ